MILADFRREYHYDPDQVWVMPTRWFKWYLNGLSEESEFKKRLADKKNKKPSAQRQSRRRAR